MKVLKIFIILILFTVLGCTMPNDPGSSGSSQTENPVEDPIEDPTPPITEETLQTTTWYTIAPFYYTEHPDLPIADISEYEIWSLRFQDEDPDDGTEELVVFEYDSVNNIWIDSFGWVYTVTFIEKVSDTVYRWSWISGSETVYTETTFSDEGDYYYMSFDIYNDSEFTEFNLAYETRNDSAVYHPDLPECIETF